MCKLIKIINYMFWAEQVGVDSPKGEKPKCYSWLDMNPDNISFRKCWNGVRSPAVKTRKILWPTKEKENHEMIN